MKKRLLIVFVAFVCAIACAVGLAACATPDGKSEGEKNPLSVAGNSYVYSSVSVANENETLRIYAEALKKEIADDMSGAVFSFDGNGGCSSVIGGKAAKGTYTQKGAEVSATLGGEAYSFDAAEKSISTTRATEYEINKGGSLLPGLSGLPAIGQTEKVSFNVTVTFVKSAGGNKPVTPVEPEKPAGSACTHIGSLWHYTDGEASTCKKEGWELDVYICKGTENEGTKDERICGKVFLTEEAAKSDDFATVLHNVEDKEELQNLTTFRKSLPLAGHTPVTDGAVEATCSEKGLTEGSHCGVCGTILKAQKETDAIEHSFTDTVTFESQPAVNVEICSMCGISREGVSYTFSLNGNKDGYILEKVGNLLSVGSMEIPCRHNGKPVTDIGENCAVNAWWLEEITIPNGIKTIGGGAFGNSQSLKKVNIPDGVESIGNGAFTFCYSLSEVTIPASVTHMGENVFYKGHGLTVYCEAAERPQGWSYSWNYIYAGQDYCTVVWDCNKNSQDGSGYEYAVINGLRYALKGDEATVVSQPNNKSIVKIPSTIVVNSKVYDVTRINSNAFHNVSGGNFSCHNLAHITIPESVTYIGSNTFGDSRVTIYCEAAEKPDGWSDGWTSDCAVVWNCNNNNEDEDGNIHTVIDGIYYSLKDGEATVRRQPNTVENVNIPSTVSFNKKNYVVTRIDDAAFYCNYNLKSVTLPDSITDICGNAFYSCLRLQCNESRKQCKPLLNAYQRKKYSYNNLYYTRKN